MQGDFFQVLRRVQREERSKSSLARVENDFYKQLRDYIKSLERSVANNPFGNEQLVLNNAQRIATEICETRQSKITKAANNNIYRSFLLFKTDNPQFDLLDTTPLNLTDEEETLYFSLIDALKSHRYRISLDEYTIDDTIEDEYEDEYDEDVAVDEDDEDSFVEDSYESTASIGDETAVSEDLEDEISDALGESDDESNVFLGSDEGFDVLDESDDESDEVLDRLNQIKDAKVITDEKYEHIDRQVANQRHQSQGHSQAKEVQSSSEDSSKAKESVSHDINDIFKDPDSQFVDLDKLESNYEEDYFNSIVTRSSYAKPTEDDFNMIFAKPKKTKGEAEKSDVKGESSSKSTQSELKSPDRSKSSQSELGFASNRSQSEFGVSSNRAQSELGFASGLDAKKSKSGPADRFNKSIENKDDSPKKPVDKTKGGLFAREEIENTTVVINENIGEMIGIDGKIYGPFLENDVVILPNINAQILIDNNKASLVKL